MDGNNTTPSCSSDLLKYVSTVSMKNYPIYAMEEKDFIYLILTKVFTYRDRYFTYIYLQATPIQIRLDLNIKSN